ncbi:MAG: hypothetical protein RQ875_05730 [Vicingaceae bacterium]|nr:hypothetical protein [Vicingaceae bacterium]
MKLILKLLLLFIVFFLFNDLELFAAGPPGPPNTFPGGGNGPPGGCWPPSACIPIDGGISYLLALGAIYGGKKIYDISKKAE